MVRLHTCWYLPSAQVGTDRSEYATFDLLEMLAHRGNRTIQSFSDITVGRLPWDVIGSEG